MPHARILHPHSRFTHGIAGVDDLTQDPIPVTREQGDQLIAKGIEYGVTVVVDDDAPVEIVVEQPVIELPTPEHDPGLEPQHMLDLAAELEDAVEHAKTADASNGADAAPEPAEPQEDTETSTTEQDQSDTTIPATPEG